MERALDSPTIHHQSLQLQHGRTHLSFTDRSWHNTKENLHSRLTAPAFLHLMPQHKLGNRCPVTAEGQEQIISTCTLQCANGPSSTHFSKPHTCISRAQHSVVTYATFHLISALFHRRKRTNTNPGKYLGLFKQMFSYYRRSCTTVMV